MDFSSYFPIWNKLTPTQQQILERNAVLRKVDKGTVIHNGTVECTGLLLVRSGQLRAYILSDEGREISLYRLFDRDICLFSASCMMNSIQFEITIEAQKDTTMWVISADTYQHIRVEQRGCEGAGQARDRQTEGDWEQAWREDAGMIVEREQNSQPDALIFDILDKNEDIGSERNCFLRKRLGMTAMWCFCRKVLPVKNEFLR